MELRKTEVDLLTISAKELIESLAKPEHSKTAHLRQSAFTHVLNGKEEVQIHVMVTRDQFDFLDDFQTEVMNKQGPLVNPNRDQLF